LRSAYSAEAAAKAGTTENGSASNLEDESRKDILRDEYLEKIKLLLVETEIKLADKYFSLGEYEKTIGYLKEVKEIDQKKYLVNVLLEEKAYRLLAEKFVKQKNYPQAIKIYKEMVLIYPEKSRIYKEEIRKLTIEEKIEKAEKLLKQGKYQKASILYEEIFQESPKKKIKLRLSEIYARLGKIAYNKKDYLETKKYWQKSLGFVPENLQILFLLAGIYREENNWQKAEKYYLRVLELDKEKKYNQVFLLLGKYYRENKLYQQAREYYEKYLLYAKESNQQAETYQELSQILSYLGQYQQAYENLQEAKKLGLKNNLSYPLKFRVYCLFRSGKIYFYILLASILILLIYFYRRYKILHLRMPTERKTLT
ncbi:MAG TPA: hypothetical protein DHV62_01530, partial [Elusimicrobia bacterium]|nr:hypothetical protein [Elusimicrobiota bacterium]